MKEAIAVRILLVCKDIASIEFLCVQMQTLAIHTETCCDTAAAIWKLCHGKFEGVIVDLELGEEALVLLRKIRGLTSHQHAISFAIANTQAAIAAANGSDATFVLLRPFSASAVARTFRAAYPMMFRERRRYYRYPIALRTRVDPAEGAGFVTVSVNISETGLAIASSADLKVGAHVDLHVELPGVAKSIHVVGEICWCARGTAGMRFVKVPAAVSDTLQGWLSERMSELSPELVHRT